MSSRIALVGGGPTAVYVLAGLVGSRHRLDIEIFEKEAVIGPGMPYRDGMNEPEMLSNIASREIPAPVDTLAGWLSGEDNDALAALGVRRDEVSDEAYYPRVVLGAFFTAQVAQLTARARGMGHRVELRTRTRVIDIAPEREGISVTWRTAEGAGTAEYQHVVIATGHDWPDQTVQDGVTLISPWPAKKLGRLGTGSVGVLGSSLSAIDAVLALSKGRGRFRRQGQTLVWERGPHSGDFRVTMLSRQGLLPEADYFYPLPMEPMPGFTEARMDDEARMGRDRLLDRAFGIFLEDLRTLDPTYVAGIGRGAERLETFADAHFAKRRASDPFDWARADLAEARRNLRRRHAVPWRYALLRAHEVFESVTPLLSEADLDRFHKYLKPVFTDNYASVPHRSVERMLALHEAGILTIAELGGDAEFLREGDRVRVGALDGGLFDRIVDARGQRAMTVAELGFPSLGRPGAVLPFDQASGFVLPLATPSTGSIQCLALPVLLRRRPFIQGLVNAHLMGSEAATWLLAHAAAPGGEASRTLLDMP
jgi:uncharacterized NAD(P)/FAD-binding protein YdhS